MPSQTTSNTTRPFVHEVQTAGVDEDRPLIYRWEIWSTDGRVIGRYIGKSKHGTTRPFTHYRRNVANILAGRPYRRSNPDGFRRIHHALADAVRNGHRIHLALVRNVEPHENINEIERACIRSHDSSGAEPWQLND